MNQSKSLPVAVDVMGGDLGAGVVVDGAVQAANDLGVASILVGDTEEIKKQLASASLDNKQLITIEHAPDFISMHDSPTKVIRAKTVISVRRAFELVEEGKACAVISPGNTGAMLAAGLHTVGAIEGINRPAIATLIPRGDDSHPTVLLDSGANIQCNAEQLAHFGILGKFYSQALFNLQAPKIAVLSNGTESSKGNDLIRAAAYILSNISDVNYVGFVEGRDIPYDVADVVVCDGFVGNIVLKTMEGSVGLVVDSIKQNISQSLRGKIGMFFAKPVFKKLFKEKLDPSSYGGAPLLGLNGIGIVCHGSSNAKAIYNAVRVAHDLHGAGLIENLNNALADVGEIIDNVAFEDGMWERASGKFESKKTFKIKPKTLTRKTD